MVQSRARDNKLAESGWSDSVKVHIGDYPPGIPVPPVGTTSGETRRQYEFSTHATSPYGESICVQFDWGGNVGDWGGPVASDSWYTEAHLFDTTGRYAIRARAQDRTGFVSVWSDSMVVSIKEQSPDIPSQPAGPAILWVDSAGTFSTWANDPSGDSVQFVFDWGNGEPDTTPFCASGDTATAIHVWEEAGTYDVRCIAKDSRGHLSLDWSVPLNVRVAVGPGPTYHGGPLDADEIWYTTGNPHICTSSVVVDGGHKLTIEPGCEVRFRAGATDIVIGQGSEGEMIAVGKPDSLIEFTADTSAPSPGDWGGIVFDANTAPTTHLSYCALDYGGVASKGALAANPGAQFNIDHCTIKHSAGAGLFCVDSGHPTTFTNNSISGSLNYPICIQAGHVGSIGTGNVLTGNAPDMDAILVAGSSVTTSETWHNLGVPYLVNGDVFIGSNSSPVVTIEPGTNIELSLNTAINIGYDMLPGALNADASGGQQILFTSSSPTPNRGDWLYIYFDLGTIDSESKLKNCRFRFGGRNLDGEIYLYNAKPAIAECWIESSAGYGIYLDGDPDELPDPMALRANNSFTGNALGDIYGP